jgi:hypothetical protein
MPITYHICSPYVPGVGKHKESLTTSSDEAATNERVDNVRVFPLTRRAAMAIPGFRGGAMQPRAAVEKLKLWENGRKLRVKYLDGIPEVQNKVTAIAKEWESVANLTLDFVTGGAAEIRISFAEEGFSWSTVGTDALTVGSSAATMNYGWL